MGIRFRKSLKLSKHTRVNIGKNGIGYSIGTKGFRLSLGSDGKVRKTHSIPGTGISYTNTFSDISTPRPTRPTPNILTFVLVLSAAIIILSFILSSIFFRQGEIPPPPDHTHTTSTHDNKPTLYLSSYNTVFLAPGETHFLCIEYDPGVFQKNNIILHWDDPRIVSADLKYTDENIIVYTITGVSDGYSNLWASSINGDSCTEKVQIIVESEFGIPPDPSTHKTTYVLNTHTKVIHTNSCIITDSISPEHKSFTSNLYSAVIDGYSLCSRCKPN